MRQIKIVHAVMFAAAVAVPACATESDDDDVAAVTEQDVKAPAGCEPLLAIARPIAAPHFHDQMLQQTAGRLTMRVGKTGVRTGTSIATLVGQTAAGVPLGNHDWLFTDAGMRTKNDTLSIIPTADPCVFDVSSEIYIVEGTGAYAGLTGTVKGVGFVDFCGAEGKITISGHVCP
jgi:hypothetical protein